MMRGHTFARVIAGAAPSPCWTTAIYALRQGEWKNVLFEELPAEPKG